MNIRIEIAHSLTYGNTGFRVIETADGIPFSFDPEETEAEAIKFAQSLYSHHRKDGHKVEAIGFPAEPVEEPVEEPEPLDLAGKLLDFESGELDEDGTIELFQHLVDTGLAWELQGSYGRTARYLIDAGYITEAAK